MINSNDVTPTKYLTTCPLHHQKGKNVTFNGVHQMPFQRKKKIEMMRFTCLSLTVQGR